MGKKIPETWYHILLHRNTVTNIDEPDFSPLKRAFYLICIKKLLVPLLLPTPPFTLQKKYNTVGYVPCTFPKLFRRHT